ncbi:glycosyltransferase family 10 [Helicobacter sp. 11S03491-1]|uniref:glycosyltransferase family 10 domain-containing protein n=1 Tax=Helicobacter sp. 11S03491-1 TaxID=1476196 RepID=UPI000BA74DEF|nr:glycosyltransferase family 10 [Helicobacter sp. 11S03491-1]PAF42304.1 hypothetical protein BKH45_05015 [Helicobacter sp. 11S03491-1]
MQKISVLLIQNTDKIYDDQWLEDWLKKQSYKNDGCYNQKDLQIIFSTKFNQSDYVVMLNRVDKNRTLHVGKDNLFALQQEPYIPNSSKYHICFKNEFAKQKRTYKNFRKVFGFVCELLAKDPAHLHYIPHHPMMYWMLYSKNKPPYKTISQMPLNQKTKTISCIASIHKSIFPGHLARREFVMWLKNQKIGQEIDFYGSGTVHELTNKIDGLRDYKYSIAIENSSIPHYFTEKIIDCYLAYTMPIYCGAPNIGEYFPNDSYITIDINKPQEAIKIIQEAITNNLWEKNIESIKKARELCLKEYNFIQCMGKIIAEDFKERGKQEISKITVKKFKRSFIDRIKRNMWRIGNKIGLI